MDTNSISKLYNSIFGDFLSTNFKLTQYEIDREYIRNILPNLKWNVVKSKSNIDDKEYETTAIDYESFYSEISKKFSKYIFEKDIKKYDNFTYYGFIIKNIFKSNEFENVRVGFYENELANLLKTLTELDNQNIELIKGFRGILIDNGIEIGIYTNGEKKIRTDIDKSIKIEYNILFKTEQVVISLGRFSSIYFSLFSNIYYNLTPYTIKINNIKTKDKNELLDFINKLEIAINLKLFYDYRDMIEFSKYTPKVNNSSSSNTIYRKPDNTPIKKQFELKYINPILLNYMQNIIRNDFPPFKFLAYYQILEHYFVECYESFLSMEFEKKKTDNFKDISDLLNIAETYRTEKKMLKLVLNKYIHLRNFKEYFYIKKNIPKIKISDEILLPSININNEESFIESLADRIYILRNAIVHSKDRKNKRKSLIYSRTDNYLISALLNEIRLIKWITEIIIESNSKSI
jgi:hypothetical protein